MEKRERLASGYMGALLAYRQALGCGLLVPIEVSDMGVQLQLDSDEINCRRL